MTVVTITRRAHRVAAAGAAVVALAAVPVAWQLWPQSSGSTASPAATTRAWFEPISRYYGNDPRIRPQFDFASLYSGYPLWFAPIRDYYRNPKITPQFDFASLYAAPR
jgi:hypothetical protein